LGGANHGLDVAIDVAHGVVELGQGDADHVALPTLKTWRR
jgi:hypothetical protein